MKPTIQRCLGDLEIFVPLRSLKNYAINLASEVNLIVQNDLIVYFQID